MARKLSAWNLFVMKIYKEGKAKNKNYDFKQALDDASMRKSEMGKMPSSGVKNATKSTKKGRKSLITKVSQKKARSKNHSSASSGKRGTRKRNRH
jgi:hypothetical protein